MPKTPVQMRKLAAVNDQLNAKAYTVLSDMFKRLDEYAQKHGQTPDYLSRKAELNTLLNAYSSVSTLLNVALEDYTSVYLRAYQTPDLPSQSSPETKAETLDRVLSASQRKLAQNRRFEAINDAL